MSRYDLDGVEVWFGTPDAPAPSGVATKDEPEITVGASASAEDAVVHVRHRRAGGPWQRMSLRHNRSTNEAHYFTGRFPALPAGSRVEYEVYIRCGGARPKPERQVGGTNSFELERKPSKNVAAARVRLSTDSPSLESATRSPIAATTSAMKSVEAGSTMKAAKLAGLPTDAAKRLATAAPDKALLGDEVIGSLISEGVMGEPDANRLGLASLALDLAEDDEAAAGKVLAALETHGLAKPQDLAALTTDEMASAIERANVTTAEVAREKAATLKTTVAKAFPTETLMGTRSDVAPPPGTSAKGPTTPLGAKPEIIKRAWKRNARVDLMRLDLSRHSPDRETLDLTDLNQLEKKVFLRDVQLRKGTLAVAGNVEIAEKFLNAGLGSPLNLASSTPNRLAKAANLTPSRAKNVHNRALHVLGRSTNGLFTLWDALRGGLADTAVGNIRRAKVREFFDGLDNLQELFGDLDYCQCKHCNSVLGPAAYFVDLMHFIQTHVLDERFEGLASHPLHLRTRRPDLWVLPLTCENTHSEIPQLQITSEILENFIAKKRGIAIKPDRSEVVASVYGRFLPSGRHSLLQPFQLPLEEIEIYLGHFNLRRSNITRLLNEPEGVQLRSELGLSAIHAELITSADPSPVNIHNKLGLTLPADGVLPTQELLKATQLSRPELSEVLNTRFVAGGQPLLISAEKKSAESVQHDIERVRGLTHNHLDRLHRFLRLKSRLAWSLTETDAFLASTGQGPVDSDSLDEVARAARLQRRFRAKIEELCALAGNLPEFPVRHTKDRSPVDELFNVPDLVRQDGPYPNPAVRFTLGERSEVATERSMRLRAGLRLDEGELSALVEGLSDAFEQGAGGNVPAVLSRLFSRRLRHSTPFALPRPAPKKVAAAIPIAPTGAQPSFPLTRSNLSLLYRHAVLARWLKLDTNDLLALIRLTPGRGDYLTGLADCAAVVEFYDWWKSTPFSIEDLSMLLAPPEAVAKQVIELWEAIQAWLEEEGELTLSDTFLTQIDGVTEELSREIIAANRGSVFEEVENGYRVLASWRDDADLDLAAAEAGNLSTEPIRSLIRSHHPDGRLPHALTEALRIDIELARAIVNAALHGQDDLTPSSFLRLGPLPDELRGAMDALLRLHRIGSALRLSPPTLAFFTRHQQAFGVSNWSEQNQGALRRIASLQALIEKRFREEPDFALAEIVRRIEDAEALPDAAASLFALDPALARDLATTLHVPDNPFDSLFKLEEYAVMARKLSVDAPTLAAIASEDHEKASAAAAAVLAGFRAKYPDEDTWRETVEPFEERVLEKKRDALIDYLLHGPDAVFPDATEMYKYFLIDGEVDGCFRTSKVVAANSSLQLYVHRIRMNLEKEAGGGLHVEPSLIPDEEWEWRQHYRVWEANRKIFLWPENYLDPTIRDDKTPLFEELESELLQQEITDQTVIDAYANYLKALEELANLRYAGSYHHYLTDDDSEEATDIIYLLGATGGEAPTHYWREIRNLARSQEDELVSPQFGPWRRVETRIPTRHVSPVVYDGQLHVFWNEITTTSQNAINDGKSRFVGYSHRYALKFTSLRLDGQWTQPERISLFGSAPAFQESDSSIDDPLAERVEWDQFIDALFSKFLPWFGIYRDPEISLDEAYRQILTPRYGTDIHTKAQEGYTLSGFMWERPLVSADPSYGHRLLVNCAGLLVRGAVDLFDRQMLRTDDTHHKGSPVVGSALLAWRFEIASLLAAWLGGGGVTQGAPDFSLLRRDVSSLRQTTWSACPFDYPVAAAIALNAEDLTIFRRHWGDDPGWSSTSQEVADVSRDAGVWAVAGTPGEVVIETEDDLLLLQPSATVGNHYLLHRIGTMLVRDIARKLFTDGVDGLLATAHQLGLTEPKPDVSGPRTTDRTVSNPMANDAAYGIYYQEIFQHIPLLIAYHLNARGKFEHAQRWYHYVFDPTSPESPTDGDAPPTDRNWKYRQFRGQEQPKLRSVLSDTTAIQEYREDPFNAHAIARLRVSAYQKTVVMRYIDNMLDWADELFTRFQMESVNEAMMLYVTAAEILGPRPAQLGECGELSDITRTYEKLKDSITKDGELLLEVEELIPRPTSALPPAAAGVLTKPVFGLTALLAFPLSKVTSTSTTKSSVLIAGQPAVAMAVGNTLTMKASGESPTVKGSLGKTDDKTSAVTLSTSQPLMMAITGSSGEAKAGADAASAMIASAMKTANAAKASKGATGFFVAESAIVGGGIAETKTGTIKAGATTSGVTMGVGKGGVAGTPIAASGFFTGAVPFTKAALAVPRTEGLVKAFALRQQFAFLGGHWKANGGRRIPSTLGDRFGRAVVRQVAAAFCIPRNEILDDYWNRVEDRIQKIRTCRDITGLKRKLSLFAPPIDPRLLQRARALGIPLDDAIDAFEGMIPQYRFVYLLEKAKAFAGTVQAFGSALQSALERKDGEELSLLQATQQQQLLALTTQAKEWELESAQVNLAATERQRTTVENRMAHYTGLLDAGLNEWEVVESISTHTASIIRGSAAVSNAIAAVVGLVPQVGSPFAMKYGGDDLRKGPENFALAAAHLADVATHVATSARLEAGHDRRSEEWTFQRDQARDQLSEIDIRIEVGRIARDLADHAIEIHKKNIEHNEELLEYHEDKFSGLGLYTWLASQLQRTYREAYNMTYRMARYAEQAYRFEREDYTSGLLSEQYWEASRAGLLAGHKLTLALQHLEQRYIETDQPKRQLTDHFFSLRQWDPKALIEFRRKGECKFKVPELFFDLSSPGDYRRRVRSVRVTIPAVAGPYVNVMATLSLDTSWLRPSPSIDLQEAPRPRVDSITTSSARNDAGVFELNFRGEKYVPFEGAGAMSEWSLSLPTAVRMFDYNTISDVVLHFDYTASFDGVHRDVVQGVTTGLVASLQQRLADDGIVRAFSLREEFPAAFTRLVAGDTAELEIAEQHLPFFLRDATVGQVSLVITSRGEDAVEVADVEFDGESLGAPTDDDQLQGRSVTLPMRGSPPWKHTVRLPGLSHETDAYLLMRLRSN